MINPLNLCPCFSDLKDTPNNSFALGKLGKGTKVHIFKESNFRPELAPKKAKVKRIKIKEENLVVMSY